MTQKITMSRDDKAVCSSCGGEFYVRDMHEFFTGRKRYLCLSCYKRGLHQITAMQIDFRESPRGAKLIERYNRNK